MNSNKKRLLAFQSDGRYLFHGSPLIIKELMPRQPVNFDEVTGEKKNDGDPCVSATPFVEIAIFRSMTHLSQFSGQGVGSSFGVTAEGNIHLAVTQKLREQLEDKTGYIYVLLLEKFSKRSNMEWRSIKKMKPLEVIKVSAEDMPENIETKEWV